MYFHVLYVILPDITIYPIMFLSTDIQWPWKRAQQVHKLCFNIMISFKDVVQ